MRIDSRSGTLEATDRTAMQASLTRHLWPFQYRDAAIVPIVGAVAWAFVLASVWVARSVWSLTPTLNGQAQGLGESLLTCMVVSLVLAGVQGHPDRLSRVKVLTALAPILIVGGWSVVTNHGQSGDVAGFVILACSGLLASSMLFLLRKRQ